MNPYPPYPGRGFGYGPGMLEIHERAAYTPLDWTIFALLLLLVLTVGALLVAPLAGGRRHRHFRLRGPDALEVLRMRFARGEITRDEYLQATSDLTAGPPPPPEPAV
jgi:uncharacterized membrane protein